MTERDTERRIFELLESNNDWRNKAMSKDVLWRLYARMLEIVERVGTYGFDDKFVNPLVFEALHLGHEPASVDKLGAILARTLFVAAALGQDLGDLLGAAYATTVYDSSQKSEYPLTLTLQREHRKIDDFEVVGILGGVTVQTEQPLHHGSDVMLFIDADGKVGVTTTEDYNNGRTTRKIVEDSRDMIECLKSSSTLPASVRRKFVELVLKKSGVTLIESEVIAALDDVVAAKNLVMKVLRDRDYTLFIEDWTEHEDDELSFRYKATIGVDVSSYSCESTIAAYAVCAALLSVLPD